MNFIDWFTDTFGFFNNRENEEGRDCDWVSEDDLEEIATDLISGRKTHDEKCHCRGYDCGGYDDEEDDDDEKSPACEQFYVHLTRPGAATSNAAESKTISSPAPWEEDDKDDNDKIDNNNFLVGWVCPKCGAAVSPYVHVCPNCSVKEDKVRPTYDNGFYLSSDEDSNLPF